MITSVTVIRQITAWSNTLIDGIRFILRWPSPDEVIVSIAPPLTRRRRSAQCEHRLGPISLRFWSTPTYGILRRTQTHRTRGHEPRWNHNRRTLGGFAAPYRPEPNVRV